MFEGEFEEGIKHGSGKMNMNDGRVIKGIWIRGTYQGEENEDDQPGYEDNDFPPKIETICSSSETSEFEGYKWSLNDHKKTKQYIKPIGNELELIYEEDTPRQIVEFLSILCKDPDYLRSIIRLPKSYIIGNPLPDKIWISIFISEKQHWMEMDTSIVVNYDNIPIYAEDTDELCLWPSFILKACAKHFGSYSNLLNVTLNQLLNVIYGPKLIISRIGSQDCIKNDDLNKTLLKNLVNDLTFICTSGLKTFVWSKGEEEKSNVEMNMISKIDDKSVYLLDPSSEKQKNVLLKIFRTSLQKYVSINSDFKVCNKRVKVKVPSQLMFHIMYFEIRLYTDTSLIINIYNRTPLSKQNDMILSETDEVTPRAPCLYFISKKIKIDKDTSNFNPISPKAEYEFVEGFGQTKSARFGKVHNLNAGTYIICVETQLFNKKASKNKDEDEEDNNIVNISISTATRDIQTPLK